MDYPFLRTRIFAARRNLGIPYRAKENEKGIVGLSRKEGLMAHIS